MADTDLVRVLNFVDILLAKVVECCRINVACHKKMWNGCPALGCALRHDAADCRRNRDSMT